MPIIPVLRTTDPLKEAPGPVLDRERRPNADFRGVAAAAGSLGDAAQLRPMPTQPFVEPYEAMGSVGRALQQTGSILGALALKRAEAENDIAIAEADASLEREQASFEEWKMANPDPRNWSKEWEKRSATAFNRAVGNEKLSPAARDAIRLRATTWQSRSSIMVNRDATKETFALAKSYGLAAAERLADAGDVEGAKAQYEALGAKGLLYPHQVQHHSQEAEQKQVIKAKQAELAAKQTDVDRFNAALEADPWQAQEALKATDDAGKSTYFPSFDADARMRAEAEVKQRIKYVQEDQINGDGGLRDRIYSGLKGLTPAVTEQEIREAGKALRLDEERIDSLVALQGQWTTQKLAGQPLDWTAVEKLQKDFAAYSERDYPDIAAQAKDWEILWDRAEFIGATAGAHGGKGGAVLTELKDALRARNPLKMDAPKDPVYGLMETADKLISAYKQDGAFGPEKTTVGDKEVENTGTTKKYINWRHKIMNDLQRAAKKDPEKFRDPGAVEEFINRALKGAKTGAAVDALRMPLGGADATGGHDASLVPGTVPTDEEIRARFNIR